MIVFVTPRRSFTTPRITLVVNTAAFLFLLYALVHLALNSERERAWEEMASISFGTLVVVALLRRASESYLEWLSHGWLLCYVVTAAVAVREVALGDRFHNYFVDDSSYLFTSAGAASTLGNPNNYAFMLLAALPFLIWGFTATRSTVKVLYLVSVVTLPYFVAATQSRTAVALLVCIAFVFALLKLRALLVLLVGAATATAIALFPATLDAAVTSTLGALGGGSAGGGAISNFIAANDSLQARFNLAHCGVDIASQTLLLGTGPGGFSAAIAEGACAIDTFGLTDPHNGLIEVFSQYGGIALLVAVVALVWLARLGISGVLRTREGAHRVQSMSIAVTAVALPFMATMHSTYTYQSIAWMHIATVFVAASVLSSRRAELDLANRDSAPAKGERPRPSRSRPRPRSEVS
ncbi:O-antigen ligase family protein [Agrococcus sp. DT81.2]|uniref:O-antigen ligase family protein n=1 Tax=Agrococcus sp. DT81.2 TaxID=3393414 RepID=UPI003CE5114F